MFRTIRHIKKTLTVSSLALVMGLSGVASEATAAEHNWRFSNLYSRGNGMKYVSFSSQKHNL